MKKAGVMAQARQEPRFADAEVLTPLKPTGVSAWQPEIDADISDAVFETVSRSDATPAKISQHTKPIAEDTVQNLGLLRENAPREVAFFSAGDDLSPGFLAFTLILALSVFWLCGGHALLY